MDTHRSRSLVGIVLLAFGLTACRPPSLVNGSGARRLEPTAANSQQPQDRATGATPAFQTQSAEQYEYRVTTLAEDGTWGFAAGSGTSAFFENPTGVAVGSDGSAYVPENPYSLIKKISPQGIVSILVNDQYFAGDLEGIYGVAASSDGCVYFTEPNNRCIRKFSPGVGVTTLYNGNSNSGIYHPIGIAVGNDGNIYVADSAYSRISKISPQGVISTLAGDGTSGLMGSAGFADGVGTSARFSGPRGVAVGSDGSVYVADNGNNCIRKISPQGVVSTLAGNGTAGFADGVGTSARFSYPWGVAVSNDGSVYVADSGNSCIRKISPQGVVSTLAGNGTSGFADGVGTSARFAFPMGVAVSNDDSVFVADTYNHRIRKIALAPIEVSLTVPMPYFSPNSDSRQDEATVSIKASGSWTLSVDGRGEIANGSGNRDLTWNGQVKGLVLPDGKYTLKLVSGSVEKTAKVVLDTVAPDVDIAVDGKRDRPVVNSIVPKFSVKCTETGSGVSGTDGVQFRFAPVDEAYTPGFERTALTANADGSTFDYQPPFQEETILYPGDQWVAADVTDRAGNTRTAALSFAVGGHSKYSDMYSGVPPLSTAYRVQGTTTTPPLPVQIPPAPPKIEAALDTPLKDEIKLSAKAVIKMNPYRVYKRFRPSSAIVRAPVYAVLNAVGVVIFCCLDLVSDSVQEDIESEKSFRLNTKIGTIILREDQWNTHIYGEGQHPELGKDATFLATLIKQLKDEDAQLEVWADLNEKNVRKMPTRLMLVIDYHGQLWVVCMNTNPYVLDIQTAYGACVFKGIIPSRAMQWSYVANKVCYLPKGGSSLWGWYNTLRNVEYRRNLEGDIIDSQKPYKIVPVTYLDTNGSAVIVKEAQADPDVPIYEPTYKGVLESMR